MSQQVLKINGIMDLDGGLIIEKTLPVYRESASTAFSSRS
jgi:hypothetical protein